MTSIFYDTEFIEDGRTIELISIGMVTESGDELYLINDDLDLDRLVRHEWLMANVVPYLPLARTDFNDRPRLAWDTDHPDYDCDRVMPRSDIARTVGRFILDQSDPELWAWFGAYDHVALAQLFGPMPKLPEGIPMWTNDIRQVVHMINPGSGLPLPVQQGSEHHALADARWVRNAYAYLVNAVRKLGAA